MNIIAIDYGEKRIGIAKGGDDTKMALPFCIIENKSNDFVLSEILKIIKNEDIGLLIIGLPLGLGGKNTNQTNIITSFVSLLEKETDIPILTMDERFTSRGANNLFGDNKKRKIDDVAAMIMLQNFLDKK